MAQNSSHLGVCFCFVLFVVLLFLFEIRNVENTVTVAILKNKNPKNRKQRLPCSIVIIRHIGVSFI